jgi:uncharacterized protein DUF6538/H-NS histone family protein
MSRRAPYLLRRGNVLHFRIATPGDLRPYLGREFTQSLHTPDRHQATPLALELAAGAKRLFMRAKQRMADFDPANLSDEELTAALLAIAEDELAAFRKEAQQRGLMELVTRKKHQIEHQIELDALREQHENEQGEQRRQHRADLELARLQAENEALKRGLAVAVPTIGTVTTPTPETRPHARQSSAGPTFHQVVDRFLARYPQGKSAAMYKKHTTVLPMLKEFIGDIPITDLRQAHINDFFDLLHRLPPRWKDECRKRNLTILELAKLDHPITLGPKSFDDTYKASVRPFLKVARKDWLDQGFPANLTTEGIDYGGDRKEGEDKQRHFARDELKRLFEGTELRSFAADPTQVHCFWLPHVGLFTGARVNEICQLNPQTDILQDAETGIWCFHITEESEGHEEIVKCIKNDVSKRRVPIHSTLLELGFLTYVEHVKMRGEKLIFPEWTPGKGRASPKAEKWFRDLIRDTGLRDETPGARLVGMHAFRSTLENKGENTKGLPWPVEHITGHAIPGHSKVSRGYKGELDLRNKQEIMEMVKFDIDFIKPLAPGARLERLSTPSAKSRPTLPPKYRHPETGATWSGRGSKPAWLQIELRQGKRLKDFLSDTA